MKVKVRYHRYILHRRPLYQAWFETGCKIFLGRRNAQQILTELRNLWKSGGEWEVTQATCSRTPDDLSPVEDSALLPPSFCQGPLSQTLAAPFHSVPNQIFQNDTVDLDPNRKKTTWNAFKHGCIFLVMPEMLSWWSTSKHNSFWQFLFLFLICFTCIGTYWLLQ